MTKLIIGIVGLGMVGSALYSSFGKKIINCDSYSEHLIVYDKYKNGGIGCISDILKCNILFMALPTPFKESIQTYEVTELLDIIDYLAQNNFCGLIVLKSTVLPGTTKSLIEKYDKLNIVHNPEFLTAKTAVIDCDNQHHIVIGAENNNYVLLKSFYEQLFPTASISICTTCESEAMKIFCNSFYAVKVQMFTEFYLLSQKMGASFNEIKNMMLKNGWINKMHTDVPGPDGNISYGGYCFPKDTNALNGLMLSLDSPNGILQACISERNKMRNDHTNVII